MTDTFNSQIDVGPPPVTLRKRRSFGAIGIIALLLVAGAAGGFLWLNYDSIAAIAHNTTANGDAPVLASASDNAVSTADFATFQQQTTTSIQTATDLLTAQQAELKRLSDQIQGLTTQVVGLTSKIDQLQVRPGAAQVAPASSATGYPVAAAPARAVVAAPRKRAAERPAGAISVGGAPLPSPAAR